MSEKGSIASIIEKFPERAKEIVLLSNLLDPLLVPSSPILVYGPSGSGKTSVCISILETLETPYAKILCSGFNSSKQLFRAIYNAASTALFQETSEIYIALAQKISASHSGSTGFRSEKRAKISKSRRIDNFSDLCLGLSQLMSHTSSQQVRLYILFSSLTSADAYEKNLTERLLNLAALSCPLIKVIAITRFCSSIPTCSLPVRFSAYTENQLKVITFRTCHFLSVDSQHKEVGRPTDLERHRSILDDAFNRVIAGTRHLNEVGSAMRIVWKRRMEIATSSSSSSSSSNDPAAIASSSASSDGIQRLVGALLRRPVMNITMNSLTDKAVELSSMRTDNWIANLPSSTLFLLLAAYVATNNPSHDDHFVFGAGMKGRKKTVRSGSNGADGDEESLLLKESSMSSNSKKPIPLDRIFSIYMSMIAKSGGEDIFMNEESLTRAERPSGSRFDSSEANSIQAAARRRSQKVIDDYGDVDLFSTVSSLVTVRLLVHGPAWSLSSPTYFCTVDSSMADDIAKHLSVPLNTFLV